MQRIVELSLAFPENEGLSHRDVFERGSIPILQIALRLEVWGYTNKACRSLPSNEVKGRLALSPRRWSLSACPELAEGCRSADFVFIAAISNRQVFLQKWDAPLRED